MPRKKGQKVTRCRVCKAHITIIPMQKKYLSLLFGY